MNSGFICIQEPEIEFLINPENINFAQKQGGNVFISFVGKETLLPLVGKIAETFWRHAHASSVVIRRTGCNENS